MFPEGFLTSATLGRAIRVVGLLLACSVFAIGFAPLARADTVYTYMGEPFTNFSGIDSCTKGVGQCSLSGSFTVAQPLPPNSSFDPNQNRLDPLAFSFTDGSNVLTQQSHLEPDSSFQIVTDSRGNISQWIIFLAEAPFFVQVLETNHFNNNSFDLSQTSAPVATELGSAESLNNNPADWTISTSTTATPEPSCLLLLGTGLMGVLGAWCRQRFL